MSALETFKTRMGREFLEPFCNSPHRNLSTEGFVASSIDKLDPRDAADFLAAIDEKLVSHADGFFFAPCSKAKEQIFWTGSKSTSPTRLTLWLEPIITMAGLLRLYRDYGWPLSSLGMQSRTWAFDLVGYAANREDEVLACEVKKTVREIDALIDFMRHQGSEHSRMLSEMKGGERNAFKKVLALRESRAPRFWALGPGGFGYVFNVEYGTAGEVFLKAADESALTYFGSNISCA